MTWTTPSRRPGERSLRRSSAVVASVAAIAATTRGSSNGSRAEGRRRRTSGRTAIASASFSGPRRPGQAGGEPRRDLRLPLRGDVDRAVGGTDGGGPMGRPVDQQPVAERHPTESQPLAHPYQGREFVSRRSTAAPWRGRRVLPCVPLIRSGRRPPVQASGRCRLSLALAWKANPRNTGSLGKLRRRFRTS